MWHDCVFSVGTLRRYDSTVEGVRTKKKMQEKKKKRPARKSQETACDSLQTSPKKPLFTLRIYLKGRVVVVQSKSCRTLCDHMDCSSARLPCPWDAPGKNPGVGLHSLLQGDLPDPGIERGSSVSAGRFFTPEPPGKLRKGW